VVEEDVKCEGGTIKYLGKLSKQELAEERKKYKEYLRTGKKKRGVTYIKIDMTTYRRKQ